MHNLHISINRLCRVFIIEQLLTLSVSNTACTFSNAICSLGSPLPARCSFLIRNKRSSVCARSANASSRLISSASRTGSTDQMLMAIFIYDSHNIQPKVFIQQCIFMSIIKTLKSGGKNKIVLEILHSPVPSTWITSSSSKHRTTCTIASEKTT